jgi:hypothetical protein
LCEQAAPAHRLILFLQQSSVEWASSLWLNVVQEVDPHFQRTVRRGPSLGPMAGTGTTPPAAVPHGRPGSPEEPLCLTSSCAMQRVCVRAGPSSSFRVHAAPGQDLPLHGACHHTWAREDDGAARARAAGLCCLQV